MKIGFIGLGRMGYSMCLNLLEHKHKLVVYDVNKKPIQQLARKGAIPAYEIKEIIQKLPKQKIIWLMIPAKYVDDTLKKLTPLLNKNDIIIDGGNSYYTKSIQRYNLLKKKGIKFLDCGTSGGIEGARYGACMMVGGDKPVFNKVEKLFKDQCVERGYGYMGNPGAGHFVKMVHNAIEYGMMGAIAEGFKAVEKQVPKFKTNIKEVAKVYSHGSIIEGKLMGWLWHAFKKPGYLKQISCEVPKGETEEEMKMLEKLSNMPILHQAHLMRERSRKMKVCGQLIAAMRNMFGGHAIVRKQEKR